VPYIDVRNFVKNGADIMNVQRKSPRKKNSAVDKRLRREDWILAAWEMLGSGNMNEVKIKILASKLGVTRGSFYWHFRNRQELIDALVDRWFAILGLREVIEADVALVEDPKEQLWAVFKRVILNIDAGQSVALRLYSRKDQKLKRRIEDEDRLRLGHYSDRYKLMGFSEDRAIELGRIYQAVVVSEYLRNGALSLDQRLAAAGQIHTTLTSIT